jgi:hypothetical protein
MGKGMTPEGGRNLENWYNSPYWDREEKVDNDDPSLVVCHEMKETSVNSLKKDWEDDNAELIRHSEVNDEEESSNEEEGN